MKEKSFGRDLSKVQTGIEVITPEIATDLLTRNSVNRRLQQATVERYAREIREGRWLLTGETIIISDSNELLNGQHRMNAVLVAGVPIRSNVVSGIERNAYQKMDSGKSRSVADRLRLPEKHTTVARTIALIHGDLGRHVFDDQIHHYLEAFRTEVEFLDAIKISNSRQAFAAARATCVLQMAMTGTEYAAHALKKFANRDQDMPPVLYAIKNQIDDGKFNEGKRATNSAASSYTNAAPIAKMWIALSKAHAHRRKAPSVGWKDDGAQFSIEQCFDEMRAVIDGRAGRLTSSAR